MVWCGVVWCGVVWCCVVWCGVVWCGVVWCGAMRCGAVSCVLGYCSIYCSISWDSCWLYGAANLIPGDDPPSNIAHLCRQQLQGCHRWCVLRYGAHAHKYLAGYSARAPLPDVRRTRMWWDKWCFYLKSAGHLVPWHGHVTTTCVCACPAPEDGEPGIVSCFVVPCDAVYRVLYQLRPTRP